MCRSTTLGAEAFIYQSFLGLLSVLFKTTQLFQELLIVNFRYVKITPITLKTPSFYFLPKLFYCQIARFCKVQNQPNLRLNYKLS